MIEWFKGYSRPSEPQYAFGDDGATFVDNAPETPAPLFAVRAFKTAIFGTPKPTEYKAQKFESQQPPEEQIQTERATGEHNIAQKTLEESIRVKTIAIPAYGHLAVPELTRSVRPDQVASPTKGILLTPGTSAQRRKTVSFSARKDFRERTKSPENAIEASSNAAGKESRGPDAASESDRKHSTLTRTLIELSTKRPSQPAATTKPTKPLVEDLSTAPIIGVNAKEFSKPSDSIVDITIDLSQPRSRSGQHWKAEYEEYHKNSTREMRKIIQYGQNVKTYAAKKDYEATTLNEKLQKELAKVARMETKVSKLAKQLKMVSARGPDGESELARLVGELAQQTATAIRYRRKADQYQRAIRRQYSKGSMDEQTPALDDTLLAEKKGSEDPFEVATVQAQLESLRETAVSAENRAARLEIENHQLKRSLARVKEEIMSYESRRQAREDRLKKREERHKTAREQCERKLASLQAEYKTVFQASEVQGSELQQPDLPAKNFPVCEDEARASSTPHHTKKDLVPPVATNQGQTRQLSLSPRKRRPQKSAVDIWTLRSPNDNPELKPSPNTEVIALAPSSVKDEMRRALLDIDHNLVAPDLDSQCPSAIGPLLFTQMENSQPQAELLPERDVANDLMQTKSFRNAHQSTGGRPASLLSHRVGSRTSTMGSVRTSSLSAERAAAAKARLAERRKSGLKKKE